MFGSQISLLNLNAVCGICPFVSFVFRNPVQDTSCQNACIFITNTTSMRIPGTFGSPTLDRGEQDSESTCTLSPVLVSRLRRCARWLSGEFCRFHRLHRLIYTRREQPRSSANHVQPGGKSSRNSKNETFLAPLFASRACLPLVYVYKSAS